MFIAASEKLCNIFILITASVFTVSELDLSGETCLVNAVLAWNVWQEHSSRSLDCLICLVSCAFSFCVWLYIMKAYRDVVVKFHRLLNLRQR
jgi:hypothetical protein